MAEPSQGWRARAGTAASALALITFTPSAAPAAGPADVYTTYGVHNEASPDLCQHPGCLYPRGGNEP